MIRLFQGLFFFWFASASFIASAVTIPLGLSELLSASTVVIRGKVLLVRDTGGRLGNGSGILSAQIEVVERIKGGSDDVLEIVYLRGMSSSPDFQVGTEYMVFLSESPFGYVTVRGYRGAVRLDRGRFFTGDIQGEPEYQFPDEFVKKVRERMSN